jgi:hypothetical protein
MTLYNAMTTITAFSIHEESLGLYLTAILYLVYLQSAEWVRANANASTKIK